MTIYTEKNILILEKGELNCADIEDAMCDYVDGDLPDSVKSRVDAHCSKCEECEYFRDTYLLTVDVAKDIGKVQMITDDIQNRLRDALNSRLGLELK